MGKVEEFEFIMVIRKDNGCVELYNNSLCFGLWVKAMVWRAWWQLHLEFCNAWNLCASQPHVWTVILFVVVDVKIGKQSAAILIFLLLISCCILAGIHFNNFFFDLNIEKNERNNEKTTQSLRFFLLPCCSIFFFMLSA